MLSATLLCFLTFTVWGTATEEHEDVQYYTNVWAVHINTDDSSLASEIAALHGFTNKGRIAGLPGYFKFVHDGLGKLQESQADHVTKKLLKHQDVHWVEQQEILPREPRGLLPMNANSISKSSRESIGKHLFNDKYWPDQWYLLNYGQDGIPLGNDINVLPVWQRGFRGEGIVVSIVDQGVDHTHPDLRKNYDPAASFDFIDNDPDPFPSPRASHGTECAGEVAAQANNTLCGVGIAPRVKMGAIRFLGKKTVTDTVEAESISFKRQYIDVYSNSWGPADSGKLFHKPKRLAALALETGAKEGRGGKGNIFTWASGNGGVVEDNCNADGYSSSIYTISIASVSPFGLTVIYGERCASINAAIYTTGAHASMTERKPLVTTVLNHKCTERFSGTSSATPLAAGVMVMVLQANPDLTWRDVQHLIVHTAKVTSPLSYWRENAAGIKFHSMLGFGMLDAGAMVSAALNWTHVPEQHVCEIQGPKLNMNEIHSGGRVVLRLNTDACSGTANFITRLEHVQVVLSLEHRRRGDLAIDVISPSGTRSTLLTPRPLDNSNKGLKDWPFMTLHLWGENPAGEWTVTVQDTHGMTKRKEKKRKVDMDEVEEIAMEDEVMDEEFDREFPRRFRLHTYNAKLHEARKMHGDLHYARFGDEYMEELEVDTSKTLEKESSVAGRVLEPWKIVLYGTA